MSNMSIDTNHFKKRLEEELQILEGELKSVGRRNPDNKNDWEPTPSDLKPDMADDMEVADSIEEYETNAGILKQLEIRYNDIKSALKRIADDTYGVCEISGKPIEKERLEANPAARTSIANKDKEGKLREEGK